MRILVSVPKGILRDSFLNSKSVKKIEQLGEVVWNQDVSGWDPMDFAERLRGIDICITGWGAPRFDKDLLRYADKLALVVHMGGSVAQLVTPEFYKKGIRIISGNDGFARSVAEGVLAYMLLALRRMPDYLSEMQKDGWRGWNAQNEGLLDQTVGIIGYGNVSSHLLCLLKPFGVRVKVCSRHMTEEQASRLQVKKAGLNEILTTCKIISVHCAASPENEHLLNRSRLEQIAEGALLINTARGNIIDERALTELLQMNRFRAVLDVFEKEPLAKDSALRNCPNVYLFPHMAGPTFDRRSLIGMELVDEMERFINNEPLHWEIIQTRANWMTQQV